VRVWTRAAVIGLLIGTTAGAILGFASGDDQDCWICFTAPEKAAVLGTFLGGSGGLLGGAIGALSPGRRWRSVDVPGRASVKAGRSGVGLAVSLRF
jgi:hypothetical protein